MSNHGTEHRKLAAIMFTDMVGYTALTQRNEKHALELLEEHRRLLRELFPKFNGREIETTGDGFLVEFASALEAARCAIEIQRALATRNISVPPGHQIQLRIGIHVGDVVHKDGHVLGDGVNIAARLQPLAEPGGICISVDVERQIRNTIEASLVKLGPTELKNIQVPLELFRIVLPWEKERSSSVERPSVESSKARPAPALIALVAALVLLAGGWWAWHWTPTSPFQAGTTSRKVTGAGHIEWLAVLPFKNYSGDTNQEFFVDGMTDILNGELSQISGLQVKSHTTAMQFKGTRKSVPEIGRELNVDAVVEGSVQRAGSRVLISVQLIEAATDRHLWARKYERDVTDVLKMQSEVTEAIAAEIKAKLTPREQTRLANARSVHPAAFEAYLKGRAFWNRRATNWFPNSVQYFEESVRLDPNFAQGYAGLAGAYGMRQTPLPPHEKFPKAKQYALKALELEKELTEAQTWLAYASFLYDWEWREAETGFKRILALNPNHATAHQFYARYLAAMGRTNESIFEAKKALELDPLSVNEVDVLGQMFYFSRQYDKAVAQARKTTALFPEYAIGHFLLSEGLIFQGHYDEAANEFKRAGTGTPVGSEALSGVLLARTGKRDEAQKILEQQLSDAKDVIGIATLAAWLGKNDLAFEWIEKARQERSPHLVYLKVEPLWDRLRADPRFTELLRRMKLNN